MKPIIVVIVSLLSITIPVFCADFYVSTAGSDSNPGTQAQPFATIQHAIDACPAPQIPCTIHLDASTWNESPTMVASNISASSNDRPDMTIVGDYNGPNGMGGQNTSVIIGCFTIEALFTGQMQSHAYLSSVTVKQVIAIAATTFPGSVGCGNIHVISCNVSNSSSHGITCQPEGYNSVFTISNCNIYNNTGGGIYYQNMSSYFMIYIYNCNIHNNQEFGINSCNAPTQYCYIPIHDNNIHDNSGNGLVFNNSNGDIYNNLIVNNQGYGIYITGSNSTPDLGGGAQNSPGNNTISGNGTYEAYNASPNLIYAKFNYWDPLSEAEMAGHTYLEVDVTRIFDHWDDSSKGYVDWDNPGTYTKVVPMSLGQLKASYAR